LLKQAICGSLNNKPGSCQEFAVASEPDHSILWVAFICLAIITVIVLYYNRRSTLLGMKRDMPEKINEAIADYFALKDNPTQEL
jgi:hypothetical protein